MSKETDNNDEDDDNKQHEQSRVDVTDIHIQPQTGEEHRDPYEVPDVNRNQTNNQSSNQNVQPPVQMTCKQWLQLIF